MFFFDLLNMNKNHYLHKKKSKRNILITCFTTSTHLNFRIQTWIRSTYAFLDVDNGYFNFSLYPTSSSVFNQIISINQIIICNSSPTGHYALFIKLVSMELNHIEVIAFLFPQIRDHSKHICVSWIKLSQLKIVHYTDLKMNGL